MNSEREDIPLTARLSEQLLLDRADRIVAAANSGPILCTTPGRAQLARALAASSPQSSVTCHFFDLFAQSVAVGSQPEQPSNLRWECAADFTAQDVAIAALPLTATGDAELTQESLQAAHECLRPEGQLWAATDNPGDHWLRARLRELFPKVREERSEPGVVYVGYKSGPLAKRKSFACEFVFRDQGRLLKGFSRPGVFAHRRIDPGARHLINSLEIAPQARVLDLGCGSGCVALAAAAREPSALIHAVDANTRAVQCAAHAAALNGLTNLTTELTTLAEPVRDAGQYDLVLANPPYFGHFQIAERFLQAAHTALRPGAQLLLIMKQPRWYAEHVPALFREATLTEIKTYWLVRATK